MNEEYEVQKDFEVSYDVERDDIGEVTQSFTKGHTLPGRIVDGEFEYLAGYNVGKKVYSTTIYLDAANFKRLESLDKSAVVKTPKDLIITGVVIFLVLIFTDDE